MAEYCHQGVFRFIYYMILLCKVENSGKEIFNDITHSARQIALHVTNTYRYPREDEMKTVEKFLRD